MWGLFQISVCGLEVTSYHLADSHGHPSMHTCSWYFISLKQYQSIRLGLCKYVHFNSITILKIPF